MCEGREKLGIIQK